MWVDWLEDLFPGSSAAFLENVDETEFGAIMEQDEYDIMVKGCIDNYNDEDLPITD